jgi:hypothetical protein
MKRQYEFEEVTFADQLIGMKVDVEFTHVSYRPATQWQPAEGGYDEVDWVHVTSIENEAGTIKRTENNTLDWCQLDGIAADHVDALMEQYERDF